MTISEILALIAGVGGIFATVLTYFTSARSTEVARIQTTLQGQKELISALQEQLQTERDERIRLEGEVRRRDEQIKALERERDERIARLRADLDAAHAKIRELEKGASHV